MDLYFVLGPLPLAHNISMAAIAIASKKLCHDIRKIILIHVISHRPIKYNTVDGLAQLKVETVSSVGGENPLTINHKFVTLKDSHPRTTLPARPDIPVGSVHIC